VSSSYRDLHYAQRPAKNIERKMIVESLAGLDRVVSATSAQYVGFGSIYFTDFLLVHRRLGLTDMLSIEKDSSDHQRKRVDFNRPFAGVEVRHGRASEHLPTLTWEGQKIVWLDYDGQLDSEILDDVETVVRSATDTTVLIVTVNARPDEIPEPPPASDVEGAPKPTTLLTETTVRVDALCSRVGGRVPKEITKDAQLGGWKLADVSLRLLNESIGRTLATRNLVVGAPARSTRQPVADASTNPDPLVWTQVMHFRYSDNAKMLTLGGVVHRKSLEADLADCHLETKEWTRTAAQQPFEIAVPRLTTREVLALDRLLPDELPENEYVNGGAVLRAITLWVKDLGDTA